MQLCPSAGSSGLPNKDNGTPVNIVVSYGDGFINAMADGTGDVRYDISSRGMFYFCDKKATVNSLEGIQGKSIAEAADRRYKRERRGVSVKTVHATSARRFLMKNKYRGKDENKESGNLIDKNENQGILLMLVFW